jgi:hypothetical protein
VASGNSNSQQLQAGIVSALFERGHRMARRALQSGRQPRQPRALGQAARSPWLSLTSCCTIVQLVLCFTVNQVAGALQPLGFLKPSVRVRTRRLERAPTVSSCCNTEYHEGGGWGGWVGAGSGVGACGQEWRAGRGGGRERCGSAATAGGGQLMQAV